jgi:hypothetical protein
LKPSTKELTKLRKSPRALLYHPVSLLGADALLVDISENGLRLRALPDKLPLHRHDKVRIEWQPLANMKPEILEARCRWVHAGEAGLSLVGVTKRQRYFIRALVHYHRNDDDSK